MAISQNIKSLLAASDAIGGRADQISQNDFAKIPNIEISSITDDSRQAGQGCLFAALPGHNVHGNQFIPQVLRSDIKLIITDNFPKQLSADIWESSHKCPIIIIPDIRPAWARICMAWYDNCPSKLIAVTGTNGKTSTVTYVRQLCALLGNKSGSIGSLGVEIQKPFTNHCDSDKSTDLVDCSSNFGLTTASALQVAKIASELAEKQVEIVSLEASSHGLDQCRLHGLRFNAAAIVHTGQDHLDYHGTMDDYIDAKCRLFSQLLTAGSVAVIKSGIDYEEHFAVAARSSNANIIWVSDATFQDHLNNYQPSDKILSFEARKVTNNASYESRYEIIDGNLHFKISYGAEVVTALLPVMAQHQISNIMCATALCLSMGYDLVRVVSELINLSPPLGRMNFIGSTDSGATMIVDFAHTPDALEAVIRDTREFTNGDVHVVFGAGGDRDKIKRPIMGKVASDLADFIWLCDDNPRFESADSIRAEIISGINKNNCNVKNVGDRSEAIKAAITCAKSGDSIIIAGKGHETGQIIGTETKYFSDIQFAQQFIKV